MKQVKRTITLFLALLLSFNIGLASAFAAEDQAITRGQLAALINQTFQITADDPQQAFVDVPADHAHANDIAIAVTTGYMKGIGENRFDPDAKVTGEHLAVIANNLLSWEGIEASEDAWDAAAWAIPHYATLDDFGLLDDLGLPAGEVTVGQAEQFAATLLYVAQAAANSPYGAKQIPLEDDFFGYTNREYLANPVIHPGDLFAGTFQDVAKKVDGTSFEIMQELLQNKETAEIGSPEWRAVELYERYIDTEAREYGIEKFRPYLDELYAVNSIEELRAVAEKYTHQFNFTPFIGIGFIEDTLGDRTKYAAIVGGTGLELGSPFYYAEDPSLANVQQAYMTYIELVLNYIGEQDQLPERAQAIFELEQQLSFRATPPEQMQGPNALFVRSTWDDVKNATQNSGLAEMAVRAYDLPSDMTVYSPEHEYIAFADSLITEENLPAIKDLLAIKAFAMYQAAFSETTLGFDDDLAIAMIGFVPEKLPVEDRARAFVKNLESQVFDKMFVSKYFSESSKNDVIDMVNEIIAKYEVRINELSWMSDETKANAIEKLQNINLYIGYPDEWKPTLSYSIPSKGEDGSLFDVMMNRNIAVETALKESLKQPYSQDSWDLFPATTVNAFYNPLSNSIIFPAAFLQAPFYDPEASRERNLGSIGAIIGHEISHAFDVNGAQYDKDGNVSNWWTEEDYAEFQKRTQQISEALSSIEFVPGYYVNGQLTLGETVADLGGLAVVLDVAADDPDADLTEVFEGYAHAFAQWMPVEMSVYLLQSDTHAPHKVRVNFTVQMIDTFYDVYDITEEDAMYVAPEERLSVW